jgi:3'(2'), 5'-bisphosphate nucleotidase
MNKNWLPDILESLYEASEVIMHIYEGDFDVIKKADNSPVTIADQKSNKILSKALNNTGILVVSEEETQPKYEDRKDVPIWLLDPLDGTSEFIKKNDEFCICIALVENHLPTFGIIAAPVNRQILFGGASIPPAIINYGEADIFNEKHHLPSIQGKMVNNVVYSRTRYTPNIDLFLEKIEAEHGICGRILKGSALKFFDLVSGRAQIYPRLWPTMEWDIAAGQAIYEAVGGEVLDFTTFAPLHYNKESLYNPKFIAKPKELKIN